MTFDEISFIYWINIKLVYFVSSFSSNIYYMKIQWCIETELAINQPIHILFHNSTKCQLLCYITRLFYSLLTSKCNKNKWNLLFFIVVHVDVHVSQPMSQPTQQHMTQSLGMCAPVLFMFIRAMHAIHVGWWGKYIPFNTQFDDKLKQNI